MVPTSMVWSNVRRPGLFGFFFFGPFFFKKKKTVSFCHILTPLCFALLDSYPLPFPTRHRIRLCRTVLPTVVRN